jgi:uncharacterized protein YjbI with pentapeptide repeats
MTDSKPPSDSEERQDEKWYDRTRYQVLLFVGGIVLFVLVGGWILDWYIEPHTSGQKKDLVQALGLLTAGVAGAVGIFFTWRGQRITQESLQDTRENSEENLRLAREGQITERFTRAIDQLGATDEANNKKLEIRLGGIYALERIAGDSLAMEDSPGRDYSTVMEVLTAYVRENTPQTLGPSNGFSDAASRLNEATAEVEERVTQPAPPGPRRPTADIQAILDVLRRLQDRVPEEYRTRLDLHEANLQGAILRRANLQSAHLRGVNLQMAILWGANLRGAILERSNLLGANLREVNFQGADLRAADLQGADLQGANLQEAHLLGAYLLGARLRQADLLGANLPGADLREAVLQGANLQEAYLQGANVTDEQLAGAQSLQGATMPDGQKYEDWLKDKEGSGKDVEND